MRFWAPLVFIFVSSTAWLLWYRRRRLKAPAEILKELYPHATDFIAAFTPKEGFDFLKDDKEFWLASKGWKGLKRRRRNAPLLVQFCQGLHPDIDHIEEEELRHIMSAAMLVSFYTGSHRRECIRRFFNKDLPHSCARTATNLYWDIERRATTLCSIYRPELLEQLYQIL